MEAKYEFQPALDYVKLCLHCAEFSRSKKIKFKCKHEKKIHNAFQNTLCGAAFEDLNKSKSINNKFRIKVYIDKQLLLVTKLE